MLSNHQISAADQALLGEFESGELPPARFHHREHLRLAYMFLVIHGSDAAAARLRQAYTIRDPQSAIHVFISTSRCCSIRRSC